MSLRRGREGGSTTNPSSCIPHTGNSQNLFRGPQILFGAPHVEFQSPQPEKMFYVLYNL